MVHTGEISSAPDPQTPARMFGPRMQHMVQKPNARPYPDVLQIRNLGSMCFGVLIFRGSFRIMVFWAVVLELCGRRQEIERSAVKTE